MPLLLVPISAEAEYITHRVKARLAIQYPPCRLYCPVREIPSIRCSVDQFDTLAVACEQHRMVTYDIAAPQGMHPDFILGPDSDDTFSPKSDRVRIEPTGLTNHLEKGFRRPTRRIYFLAVVQIDNLGFIIGAKNIRCPFREVEKEIDSDPEVPRPYDRDPCRGGGHCSPLVFGVPGRPDHHRLAMRCRRLYKG